MKISELGPILAEQRKKQNISFADLKRKGIGYDSIKRIESNKNYNVGALFKYLEQLSYFLVVDGKYVEDIISFGSYLRQKRMNMEITFFNLEQNGLHTQQALTVERGGNYFKDTLEKYVSIVNVDFDVIFMLTALGYEQ